MAFLALVEAAAHEHLTSFEAMSHEALELRRLHSPDLRLPSAGTSSRRWRFWSS